MNARGAQYRSGRPHVAALLLALLLCGCLGSHTPAQEHVTCVPEHQLKAAYLYNFVKFVTWPKEALGGPHTPITIGFLDIEAFGNALDLIRGRTAQGRPIRLKPCPGIEDIAGCHVLYTNSSDRRFVRRVLEAMKGKPVLTVGRSADLLACGGIVSLAEEDDRLRIRINNAQAERAGLKISALLLQVATVVTPAGHDLGKPDSERNSAKLARDEQEHGEKD